MTTAEQFEFQPQTLDEKLTFCEQVLGYRFNDRELLELCLTHSSVATNRLASNERLEFLGDSILGAVVCEMLFHRFPEEPEGEMTRLKSALVSRRTCAHISQRLDLGAALLLGKGLLSKDKIPPSILAAVFEALVAGVYLDGGLESVRAMIERVISPELEDIVERDRMRNFKSALQQFAQKDSNQTPVYRLLDEKGPDHSKCFKVCAVIGPKLFPAAWGMNKKQAEQRAASNALAQLEGREIPYVAD